MGRASIAFRRPPEMSQPHSQESSTEPVQAAPVTLAATAIDSSEEDEDENEDEELIHISLPQAMPCQHRLANPYPGLLPLRTPRRVPSSCTLSSFPSSFPSSFSLALHSHLHPTLIFTTLAQANPNQELQLERVTPVHRRHTPRQPTGDRRRATYQHRRAGRSKAAGISRLLAAALWTASLWIAPQL